MNDYSIHQAKNHLFQVGGRPESTPGTRTRYWIGCFLQG